jgi:cation diffusion facilitator family transporter
MAQVAAAIATSTPRPKRALGRYSLDIVPHFFPSTQVWGIGLAVLEVSVRFSLLCVKSDRISSIAGPSSKNEPIANRQHARSARRGCARAGRAGYILVRSIPTQQPSARSPYATTSSCVPSGMRQHVRMRRQLSFSRLRPAALHTPGVQAAAAARCSCRHGLSRRGLATAPPRPDEGDTRLAAADWAPGQAGGNDRDREQQQDVETADAVRITGIGSVVNLVLSAAKGGAGVACGSSALIADAVHSLSDLASDAATVLAVRLSRKPADHDHPYGHGRYETVGALTVSGMVALSGLGIGVHSYEAMMALAVVSGGDVAAAADGTPMPVAAAVAAASILAKELLFQQTKIVAQRIRSDSLLANAWHHRSDAMSSVVALGGVVGTIMGLPLLDPLAGLVVGGLVIRTGAEMAWESIKV